MIRVVFRAAAAVLVLVAAACDRTVDEELERQYRSREWFDLRTSVAEGSPELLRGAVAAAFNEPSRAERLLRSVIAAGRGSTAADDAHALLSQIYMRSGQYTRFAEHYADWETAFPNSARMQRGREDLAKLRGRPDQRNPLVRRAMLRHDDDSFSLPVTIDGHTDDFLFDTGAWQSVLTEAKAKQLGLTLSDSSAVMMDASGTPTHFKTSIVPEVVIGEMRFHDVSFAVLTGGPLKDVDAGIVGMPILLALGAVRWSKDGTVTVGTPGVSSDHAVPNLVFDRNRLLVRAGTRGKTVLMTFDSGARTSDLNTNFSDAFPDVVATGRRGWREITGAGGTRTFDSIELPELAFTIGSSTVALRPARVTLQRLAVIGGECCVGNAGHDLLTQTDGFTIDFGTMTLRLD